MSERKPFSVDTKIAAIEQGRQTAGMAALYEDIWLPIEKERREKVLEESKQEVFESVRDGRYARAEFILERLRRHYDAETVRNRVEKFLPMRIETKPASEAHKIILEHIDQASWTHFMSKLMNDAKQFGIRWPDLVAMQSVRRIDEARFDSQVYPAIEESLRKPDLESGANAIPLATIDPAWRETDEALDRCLMVLEYARRKGPVFVEQYAMTLRAFGDRLRDKMPFDEDDWQRALAEQSQEFDPTFRLPFLSSLEDIQPGRLQTEGVSLPTADDVRRHVKMIIRNRSSLSHMSVTDLGRITNVPTK